MIFVSSFVYVQSELRKKKICIQVFLYRFLLFVVWTEFLACIFYMYEYMFLKQEKPEMDYFEEKNWF